MIHTIINKRLCNFTDHFLPKDIEHVLDACRYIKNLKKFTLMISNLEYMFNINKHKHKKIDIIFDLVNNLKSGHHLNINEFKLSKFYRKRQINVKQSCFLRSYKGTRKNGLFSVRSL